MIACFPPNHTVDAWKIRTGHNLSVEQDFKAIGDAIAKLSEAPIYIDDAPGNNILKMRAVARRLKSEKKLGLIVVDYLQLMVPTQAGRYNDNLVQQVTEISRSLKTMARELEVPVLALSQLSRAVEQRGGKPRSLRPARFRFHRARRRRGHVHPPRSRR